MKRKWFRHWLSIFCFRTWPIACEIEGLLVQYCYLSSMLWLNAMAFEVWLNFRKLRTFAPQRLAVNRNTIGCGNPKFKWYALYAWCLPLVISLITILMQHFPERYTKGEWKIVYEHIWIRNYPEQLFSFASYVYFIGFVVPNIGRPYDGKAGTCVIEFTWGLLCYVYIVSSSSILLSIILFGLFVWNLFFGLWSKENQRILEESSVKTQFDNANIRLRAAIRVFLTLGLTWICDIASWALRWR